MANLIDLGHYGISLLLFIIGLLGTLGVQLPGVTVSDPKTIMFAGLGVLVAGFKSGFRAK